ncbi:hypothetical protein FOL47_002481, partial [Perkinsus chesapeaki]
TYVAGIKTKNLEHGFKLTSLEDEHLQRALKSALKRNREGEPVNKMEPITVSEARMAMTSHLPHMREIKICMLISLFAVMRATECFSLDTEDVNFKTTDSMDIALLTIKQSKCHQSEYSRHVNTHSLRRSGAWWMWLARIPRVNRLEFGRWALDTTLEKFYLTGVTHTQSHKRYMLLASRVFIASAADDDRQFAIIILQRTNNQFSFKMNLKPCGSRFHPQTQAPQEGDLFNGLMTAIKVRILDFWTEEGCSFVVAGLEFGQVVMANIR